MKDGTGIEKGFSHEKRRNLPTKKKKGRSEERIGSGAVERQREKD